MKLNKALLKEIPWLDISRLVIPQVLLMLTTLILSLSDMWVAGKISSEVQAVVGVNAQIQAFMMILAMSLGSGAMAVISQTLGARQFLRARRYVLLVLYLALTLACVFSAVGFSFGQEVMNLLDIPKESQHIGLYFWNVLFLALPLHYLYFISNILFRASKLVYLPLFIGVAVTLVNIFGNLAFGLGYFGFTAYGVPGVAWSTFAAVLTGSSLSLILLKRAKLFPSTLRLSFAWMKNSLPYLVRVALPALLTQGLWQTGYLILFGIAASVPDSITALAGLSAGMRIESILFMPGAAFNATASILVGHALGEGNKEKAKQLGATIWILGTIIMSLIALIMFYYIDFFSTILSEDPLVIDVIKWYLIINIVSTPFTLTTMTLNGSFTGAGATIYALFINTFCIWGIRLPLAIFFAHGINMEIQGVFLAMLISMAIQSMSMLYVFLKRPWYNYAMKKKMA